MKQSDFRLFGIFGYPLSHTLSPAMQEAAFEAAGIKAFYLALELSPKSFKKAMRGLSQFLIEGFNVTVPYKETVIPFLDGISREAKIIGAVNTVYKKGNRWLGTNTDVHGFLTALAREGQLSTSVDNSLILGAGGSARAVLYGLASRGARKIRIANRHEARAVKLSREFARHFPKTKFEICRFNERALAKAIADSDLVVNCTSVGLRTADKPIVKPGMIPRAGRKKILFFDLIYRPEKTAFLKAARTRGHKTLNGLGMLLYQGAKSFETWTGKKAPVVVMQSVIASVGDTSLSLRGSRQRRETKQSPI